MTFEGCVYIFTQNIISYNLHKMKYDLYNKNVYEKKFARAGIYNDIPKGVSEKDFLKEWHLPRIQHLIKNGVDILAFETCPKSIEGNIHSTKSKLD